MRLPLPRLLPVRPEVQVEYRGPGSDQMDPAALESALAATFEYLDEPVRELTLQLSTVEKVQDLNRRFRAVDRPTDVLAFPSGEEPQESGSPYLGDIIIAVPKAAEQAAEQRHSLQDELILLTIHGLLHLLGFDHDSPTQKQEMWRAQDEILKRLGLGHVKVGNE